jgi:hypothetical protein
MFSPCCHAIESGGSAIHSLSFVNTYYFKRRKREREWPLPLHGKQGQAEHWHALCCTVGLAGHSFGAHSVAWQLGWAECWSKRSRLCDDKNNLGVRKVSTLSKNPSKKPITCFAHEKPNNLPHFQNQRTLIVV